jgi:multidrug efflux pump subunit AcrA (membrane-fusion protein)
VLRNEQQTETIAMAPLKADAVRSERDLTRLKKELAKKQTLASQRVVSESELDAAIAQSEKSQTDRLHLDAQVSQKEIMIEKLARKAQGLQLQASIDQDTEELAVLEARRTIAALKRELTAAKLKLERASVRAPAAGIVHALAVKAPGESLRADDIVCRLVPPGLAMVAEIELPAADIGFVHVDQRAKVKLDAFPFEDYGAFAGTIEYVAPDAEPESPDNRKRRPAYTVRVRFDDRELLSPKGKPLRLRPGMTLAAELVNRRETLGAVLFRPMRAAGAEMGMD